MKKDFNAPMMKVLRMTATDAVMTVSDTTEAFQYEEEVVVWQ